MRRTIKLKSGKSRTKSKIEASVNSSGKPWSQSRRRKGRLWWEEFAEKEDFKPGRGDESGESMEPIGEVHLTGLGESEFKRLVSGRRREVRGVFIPQTGEK